MRENHVVPLDGSWHGPCVGMPQRSVASAIASVGVPHSACEVAMLAPLGGTGVVAPVPYTGPNFSGLPRGRGAHYEGDAPSDPSFATLPHPLHADAARSTLFALRPTQPFAIEENCNV